ncbi:gag-pol polyprotein [Penicillium longicatenatum]|uniref:gag-pol polyprotein n=1 Tax=Penicillium longicatenatum TaxID=1561947 RepID=UPI0025491C96|nr:gag-pol polyprotein [Penicillium longicatenatum]KAJ5651602.1 gag-pol polyprotein [Penicillium longicatenatum]
MTAIMTPMGLVRMVIILQGGANSVAQCQRVVQFVLADAYGKAVQAFLDDFGIKGPKTTYNDEMAFSRVRRYILEHLQNLDKALYLLELTRIVISAKKSQFAMSGVTVYDKDRRRLDEVKVTRLVFWPVPTSIPEVRSFMGLAVYFRVVVEKFGVIIAPLYLLLKAGADFKWEDDQQLAFDEIKRILSTFPCVLPIDYDWLPLIIIVAVDASRKGWGAVMMQVRDGIRKPARYELGTWSESEQTYDAGKRECRGVLKALKKFRHWLYGLAWIRLFDFEVKHVPRDRHGATDGLSRRPHIKEEIAEQETEEDVDEFILAKIGTLRVMLNPVTASIETPLGVDIEDMTQSQEPGGYTRYIWEQVYINTATLPNEDRYQCMIQAREALTRPLKGKATGLAVCEFIWEDIICRYGFPLKIVMDKGPEFRLEKKGIKRVAISLYNPGSNRAIERSIRTFKDALLKMTSGYSAENAASELESRQHAAPPSWRACFYATLMANRMTTCATTGMTPYHFLYRKDAILPLEMEKDQDVTEAIYRFKRIRERNKTYFNSTKVIRLHPLEVGNLVLVHNTQMQDDVRALQKLRFRLEELDGTPIKHWFSAGDGLSHSAVNGDRLKRFWLYRETGVREQSFPPQSAETKGSESEGG